MSSPKPERWLLSTFISIKLIRVGVFNKDCLPGELLQLLSYHFPRVIYFPLGEMFVKLVSSGSTLPVLCCLTANNVSVDVECRRGCDWLPAVWLQHWSHQCPSEGKINICKHGKKWKNVASKCHTLLTQTIPFFPLLSYFFSAYVLPSFTQ